MFDPLDLLTPDTLEAVRGMAVLAVGVDGLDDAVLVDLITAAEDAKNALAGLQAHLALVVDTSQRDRQAAAGVPTRLQGRGVAEQVALARKESPSRGRQHLGLAKILASELPRVWAAFRQGRISEWRATLIARETACLDLQHRGVIDDELAGTPSRVRELVSWSDQHTVGVIRTRAAALDAAAVAARRRKAESERRVTCRPAPDTMLHVHALLPVREGVAVMAALRQSAATATAAGDDRTRGQLMADTLVARVTGRDPVTDPVPVTVNVVLPDTLLLNGPHDADQPVGAWLDGYGPIPADLAREWATETSAATADQDGEPNPIASLRRLYAGPATGQLVAMESTTRRFPAGLATFIRFRDRICRTPWCDAPIREIDHLQPWAEGGRTSADNGQGLCLACNRAKQAPGWRTEHVAAITNTAVRVTTPTGHTYTSTAPHARAATGSPDRTSERPTSERRTARAAGPRAGPWRGTA